MHHPQEDHLQLPSPEDLALRMFPMPADLNPSGDVFGGWILANVDVAGAIPAWRRARGRVATKAVQSFQFNHPIQVGDLVSFYARIIKEGTSSMTVDVQVFTERRFNPKAPDTYVPSRILKVTEAVITYVAVDEHGKKRSLPPTEG